MPDFAAALDALGRLVDKVGFWNATLMAVLIAIAITNPLWLTILRQWAKERRENKLEWAKFEHAKALKDEDLRQHGMLTKHVPRTLMPKPRKRGGKGTDDHG